MPVEVEYQRVRIAGNAAFRGTPVDLLTGTTPEFWEGGAAQIEVCHVVSAAELAAISNFSFVTLEIKEPVSNAAPDAGSAPLRQVLVEAEDFDPTVAIEDWTAGTKQHFVFRLSDAEMALAGNQWLLCYATTIAGNTVTLFAGIANFKKDGGPSVGSPDPVAEDAWTKAEADARFALKTDIHGVVDGADLDALRAVETAGIAVPKLYAVCIGDTVNWWRLRAGTEADDGVSYMRPNDYAETTNEKVYAKAS